MSNSKLVNYTRLSPNFSSRDGAKIKKITIHHMAGDLSVETCGNVFAAAERQASSTYGIGSDGRVGRYVDEAHRPWTSSSYDNDRQAVTIEVANDEIGGNWHVSDIALNKLIELCVDICKRNGISKLNFTGDKTGNLTMHRYFANTNCPGPYLESKYPYIVAEVNKRLNNDTTVAPTPPVQDKPIAPAQKETEIKRYRETGKCTICVKEGVYFYDKPYISTRTGSYEYNESVNYDLVVITNKYVYISWISASKGVRRYMPVLDKTNNERWGNCI